MVQRLPCITLVGPTGTRKTDLSIRLAQHFPLEIISMDSVQVYKGMDIGSAKISPSIRQSIPHHMIDICYPNDSYSVSNFLSATHHAIDRIQERGNTPLIVGGSMMYYYALLYGLDTTYPRSDQVRQIIQDKAQAIGWPALHQELHHIDPDVAKKIHPSDARRIERALEIFYLSGQKISNFHTKPILKYQPQYSIALLVDTIETRRALEYPLYKRIQKMFDHGFLDEVKQLMHTYPDLNEDSTSMKSVGYHECFLFLSKALQDHEELKQRILISTRQLVKKQCTWLKRFYFDQTHLLSHHHYEMIYADIYQQLTRFFSNIANT